METTETLKRLSRSNRKPGHGARLRRALLVLAVPATAALATACYGVPHQVEAPPEPAGYDCDGDGTVDTTNQQDCETEELSMAQ